MNCICVLLLKKEILKKTFDFFFFTFLTNDDKMTCATRNKYIDQDANLQVTSLFFPPVDVDFFLDSRAEINSVNTCDRFGCCFFVQPFSFTLTYVCIFLSDLYEWL